MLAGAGLALYLRHVSRTQRAVSAGTQPAA